MKITCEVKSPLSCSFPSSCPSLIHLELNLADESLILHLLDVELLIKLCLTSAVKSEGLVGFILVS